MVKQAQLQAAKLDFQSLSQQGLPQSALAYLTRFDKAKATDAQVRNRLCSWPCSGCRRPVRLTRCACCAVVSRQVDSDGNTLLHSIAEVSDFATRLLAAPAVPNIAQHRIPRGASPAVHAVGCRIRSGGGPHPAGPGRQHGQRLG